MNDAEKAPLLSSRKLPSCLDAYMELTKNAPAPKIFRKWAGLSLVGGMLTRRAWIRTEQGTIYPNSATILVGAASLGKGPAIDPVERLWRRLDTTHDILHSFEGIHIGPGDCTVAGLFDEFIDDGAQKSYDYAGEKVGFSSIILVAEELSAMMHNTDTQMMGYLIKFLNCQTHSQRLRGKGETQTVDRPVLHILGGVQPKMLTQIFPAQSFGMGLAARTTFVYSEERVKISPFKLIPRDRDLEDHLVSDLRKVGELTGPFLFEEMAQERIEHWWLEEADQDRPTHPKLEAYSGKRILHLFRLCMIFCAARTDYMTIELEDVENALSTMHEVEKDMHKIFDEMSGETSSEDVMADIYHQVRGEYFAKDKTPVPYHIVTRMVARKVKPYEIPQVIQSMVDQKLLEEVQIKLKVPGAGPKAYIPIKETNGETA